MAVAVTGTPNVQSNTASSTNKTLTFTSQTYGADELIVVVVCQNAASVFPVPGTPAGGSLTYTQILDQQGTGSNFCRTTAWWATTGAGGTYAVTQQTTRTTANLSTQGVLYRLTGTNTTTPVGATDGHNGNSADPLTSNTNLQLTTASAGAMLFVGATDWSASAAVSISFDSGLTATTDLNALESGEARFIAFRSDALPADDSDVRAQIDVTGGTGNWACVFFEIEAPAPTGKMPPVGRRPGIPVAILNR